MRLLKVPWKESAGGVYETDSWQNNLVTREKVIIKNQVLTHGAGTNSIERGKIKNRFLSFTLALAHVKSDV